MNAIEIHDLTKDYRSMWALDHLDLTLEAGHVVAPCGDNGATRPRF